MDFFIKTKATLPILKLEIINDGRNDFRKFHEKIQNAVIKFSMYDITNGVKRIANSLGDIELKEELCDDATSEYYVIYKWKARDTKKSGSYKGEFTITFLDGSGTLNVPIREDLFIHIKD